MQNVQQIIVVVAMRSTQTTLGKSCSASKSLDLIAKLMGRHTKQEKVGNLIHAQRVSVMPLGEAYALFVIVLPLHVPMPEFCLASAARLAQIQLHVVQTRYTQSVDLPARPRVGKPLM